MKHLVLYAIVFVAGAAVLAIEILGTRILGPFYGVSLFLWSALITVTLVALAVGYWLGGRWADRGARLARLGWLLGAAGLWLLAIPWTGHPLLAVAEPLGIRLAVLVSAFVLFAPPLTLLGMVAPYAIRLRAASLSEVGRSAGDLYALSTLASVLAALATGFWLIPTVGVTRLVTLVGVMLLLGAAAALGAGSRGRSAALVAVALAGAGLASAGLRRRAATQAASGEAKLIAALHSPYADVRVVDAAQGRFLLIDGGIHTVVDPESWRARLDYVAVVDIVKNFFPKPGRLLLVGLGGGSVAKSFAGDGWSVDAVEIDATIVDVARRYFGLLRRDARVFTMDGRAFLRRHRDAYDVVVLDAFGSCAIPFHLITGESFDLVARRLRPGGVLAVNIESVGWRDPLVASVAATLGRAFTRVVALPIAEPPNALGNLVLLASERVLELDEEKLGRPFDYLSDPDAHRAVVQRNHAWDNRFAPDAYGKTFFTDDLNPVDVLAERINLEARRRLHAHRSLRDLAW
jgi:spermidine synthase